MIRDITYCMNYGCPHVDCERHWKQIENESGPVSIADFGGVCRRYLSGLLDEIEQEEGAKDEQMRVAALRIPTRWAMLLGMSERSHEGEREKVDV